MNLRKALEAARHAAEATHILGAGLIAPGAEAATPFARAMASAAHLRRVRLPCTWCGANERPVREYLDALDANNPVAEDALEEVHNTAR